MIPQQIPVKNHWGNNSTTVFDFDFYIENEEQISVTHTDLEGNITNPVLGVDYSVNQVGNTNGSNITFPIEGSTYSVLGWDTSTDQKELLTISLDIPIEQPAEYSMSGDLSKKNLEYSFDYLTRICQIIYRMLKNTMKIPEGSSISNLILPQPKANNVFKWKDDGTGFENYDIIGSENSFKSEVNTSLATISNEVQSAISEFETETNTKIAQQDTDISDIATSVNSSLTIAQSALDTATTANTNSAQALLNAGTALTNSQSAINTATSALDNASVAVDTANDAAVNADNALTIANAADEKVDEFGESIDTVIEAADKVHELESAVEEAKTAATTASTAATNATNAADAAIAALANKQDTLVSGTNIKTINNTSLLGNGNIDTKQIYFAQYGTTSIDDVIDAFTSGKMVYCTYTENNNPEVTNAVFQLTNIYGNILAQTVEYEFSYTLDDKIYSTKISSTINTNNGWATITYNTIPASISDLIDDTSTTPVDKADTLTGLTASIAELNYTDGVTSNIQTQLNNKVSTSDIWYDNTTSTLYIGVPQS